MTSPHIVGAQVDTQPLGPREVVGKKDLAVHSLQNTCNYILLQKQINRHNQF